MLRSSCPSVQTRNRIAWFGAATFLSHGCAGSLESMIHFTLYSRTYCHLCDDMMAGLQAMQSTPAFAITVVDVDTDPALTEKYDELVPVVTARIDGGPQQELCHYFLDVQLLQRLLSSQSSI